MITATHRMESVNPLATLAPSSTSSTSSSSSTTSFAQQLASAIEGDLNQSSSGSQLSINVSEVSGQTAGQSQFLVTVTPASANTVTPVSAGPTSTASSSATTSDIPTMLGMGPVAGTAPVQESTNTTAAASTAPISEVQAYWNAQPAAVQALQNMPVGPERSALALNLANEGYSIDTQIMVWGWDPQMTMTVRANDGYSWVPSDGQANIPVAPGLSVPGVSSQYSPGDPPAGAIEVSTAFANGTIQNPLLTTNSATS